MQSIYHYTHTHLIERTQTQRLVLLVIQVTESSDLPGTPVGVRYTQTTDTNTDCIYCFCVVKETSGLPLYLTLGFVNSTPTVKTCNTPALKSWVGGAYR